MDYLGVRRVKAEAMGEAAPCGTSVQDLEQSNMTIERIDQEEIRRKSANKRDRN